MDLENHAKGTVQVKNKPERAARIREEVEAMVSRRRASPSELEALRGGLNFAKAQCFGKRGAAALHYLSAAVKRGPRDLDDAAVDNLRF